MLAKPILVMVERMIWSYQAFVEKWLPFARSLSTSIALGECEYRLLRGTFNTRESLVATGTRS